MEKKDFEEAFPALAREMAEGRTQTYRVSGVRYDMKDESSRPGEHTTYMPDVVDYIRRCDTVPQALEIVDYMLGRGEISKSEATAIKKQLKTQGLRSFGTKKERDHYLHHGIGQ
ncbi:MAG: DUF2095 family protein [Candidatus Thorarchaeota archaeon]